VGGSGYSLDAVAKMPAEKQLESILRQAVAVPHSVLQELVTNFTAKDGPGFIIDDQLLKLAARHAVLVCGNWVLKSSHVSPPGSQLHECRDVILALLARDGLVYRRALVAALPLPSHQLLKALETFAVKDKRGRCWVLKRPVDSTFELTYCDTANEQAAFWAARSGELRGLIGQYDKHVSAERLSSGLST